MLTCDIQHAAESISNPAPPASAAKTEGELYAEVVQQFGHLGMGRQAEAPGWQPPPTDQSDHTVDHSRDTHGGETDGGTDGPRRYPSRSHAPAIAHWQCEHQLPKPLLDNPIACMELTKLL